ncbi:MAG: hypothetical protein OHK0012_25770 [Synechococcales cyanobacterium]
MRYFAFLWVAVLHLVLGVVYLLWRVLEGMGDPAWWAWLVWFAEVFLWGLTLAWMLSRWVAPQHSLGTGFPTPNDAPDFPNIDVWLFRRWDSWLAIEQTLNTLQAMSYPQDHLRVRVVDLEDAPEIRQQVIARGGLYTICEGTRDPWQCALAETPETTAFIVMLDPGHLPDQQFLPGSLTIFQRSPQVAYGQALLRSLGQTQTDHPLQTIYIRACDTSGMVPLLGTGCMVRRQALLDLGSLDSRQPVKMGYRLHGRGWLSFALPSQVTGALLPLRNRRHALLAVLNALKPDPHGLVHMTLPQRYHYVWLGLWSMSGWATLTYLLVPILYLGWGIAPVPTLGLPFWPWFVPYIATGRLAWSVAFWGSLDQAWQAERQTGSQFFQSLRATWQWLRGHVAYRERPSQWSVWPQVVMVLLTLTAIIGGCLRFAHNWDIGWGSLIFALLWSVYNLAILTARPPELIGWMPSRTPED